MSQNSYDGYFSYFICKIQYQEREPYGQRSKIMGDHRRSSAVNIVNTIFLGMVNMIFLSMKHGSFHSVSQMMTPIGFGRGHVLGPGLNPIRDAFFFHFLLFNFGGIP